MSRLSLINSDNAVGKQKELLDALAEKFGKVPAIMQSFVNSPATIAGYITLFGNLSEGRFSDQLARKIGLAIGEENGCEYCISLLAAVAKQQGLTEEDIYLARKAKSIDPKEQSLLDFLIIVMRHKGDVTDIELQLVKGVGWEDADIAELFGHIALNFLTNYFWKVARTDIDYPVLRLFDQNKIQRGNADFVKVAS